ncbi:hypothetical protein L6164_035838 [Bauhinia variegata]|uniref:Uncharacterized protein n=1 Tax=Bauhinia variegata TaxID=167791 RepID=A0ACB9KF81_BAUVA|nr:hypothetical protein L6164_035838 [Bauhinia variegata]
MLSIVHHVSGVDPLDLYCPSGFPNYTMNSPFYNNLKLLLGSLPCNTSVTGFHDTFVGEGTGNVYGQALCRGDVSAAVCQNCVENASRDILRRCKKEQAIIWYELCQVRYSFQMFFSTFVYVGKFPEHNNQERNVSDPYQFSKVLSYLMSNLSAEAASNIATNMFATGEIKFSGKNTIYGLVQCTRDMSETYCSNCLSSAVGDLMSCCSYREGSIILSRTCNVRFELFQFFNTSYYQMIYPTSKVVKDEDKSETVLLQELANPKGVTVTEEGELVSSKELVFMNLETLNAATDGFSDRNKLGQGGSGAAWRLWNEGKEIEFVDAMLLEACHASLVIRWMHIGLLCAQEDPRHRPNMSDVVIQLGSESMALPKPKQPAFSLGRAVPVAPSSLTNPSMNKLTTSTILP